MKTIAQLETKYFGKKGSPSRDSYEKDILLQQCLAKFQALRPNVQGLGGIINKLKNNIAKDLDKAPIPLIKYDINLETE